MLCLVMLLNCSSLPLRILSVKETFFHSPTLSYLYRKLLLRNPRSQCVYLEVKHCTILHDSRCGMLNDSDNVISRTSGCAILNYSSCTIVVDNACEVPDANACIVPKDRDCVILMDKDSVRESSIESESVLLQINQFTFES